MTMKIQLSNLEKEQLKSVALPIWKNIVDASRDQDYARFSRGFSSELRAKLSEEHFRMSCQEIMVDSREVIESFKLSSRSYLEQVLIAGLILRQQQ